MADLKSKQIKFPLTETNVVSSSAQIATDISGSFVDASGSFSTRVTTAESELGNTLISGSAQIATDISGSFVAPSASFSTRVTTAETELGNTLLSGSAQIATDISGSFVAPSASFSTRVTTAESELGNTLLSGSAQISDDISGSLSAAAVVGLGAGIISGSSSNSNLTTAIVSEGANIVSSSAQVSADVSGSLSAAAIVGLGAGVISGSSSNSSLTTAIVGEGANIVSASAQLSTDISGSFVAPSASFSTRVTTTENVVSSSVISGSAQVDHDATTNFVANEHIDHSGVDITAGAGLTGGGDITSTRTLAVGQGTGVTVNANDIAIGQAVETDSNVQFNNVTVDGDLVVNGTQTLNNTTNLLIEDRFILMNSGSSATGDGGILVGSGSAFSASAFIFDDSEDRWGVQIDTQLGSSAATAAPEAYASLYVLTANTGSATYAVKGNIKIDDGTGDIFIYS